MTVMTAQELADYAQDAFESDLMDDPTPYEMGRAWKCVGERLFAILSERAEEERALEIGGLCAKLRGIDKLLEEDHYWVIMIATKAADALERQAAEIKQLRETIERNTNESDRISS